MTNSIVIERETDGVVVNVEYGWPVGALIFFGLMLPLQSLAIWHTPEPQRFWMFGLVAFAAAVILVFFLLVRPRSMTLHVTASTVSVLTVRRFAHPSTRTLNTADIGFLGYTPGGRNNPGGMFVKLMTSRRKIFLAGLSESQVDEVVQLVHEALPEVAARWKEYEQYNRNRLLSLHLE